MPALVLICLSSDPMRRERLLGGLAVFSSHLSLVGVNSLGELNAQLAESAARDQVPALLLHDPQWQTELVALAPLYGRCRLLCLTPDLEGEALRLRVQELGSQFVLQHPGLDLLDYARVLAPAPLLDAHVARKLAEYGEDFMDFTRYDDVALSRRVIDGLYRFFAERDEHHACRRYSPGHLLTREGERNEFLWFIASGEVVLHKRDESGVEREVVRHQAGALVGGMSFVTGEPAFTTGVTLTPTEVIKLDKRQFAEVMRARSDLLPAFTHLLLRHFNRRLQHSICTKMALQRTLQSLDDAYRQLVENEKMVMLGQLVAGVAHELNNPVSAILRGSETLSELVPDLINLELVPEQKTLGNLTLCRALQVQALSTSTIRERTRKAEGHFGDRQQARLAVQMQLDDDASWLGWFANLNGPQRDQLLAQLEQFHQAGTFLRNIAVCARRIGDLVRGLKQFARQDGEAPSQCDLLEGLEDTLVIFESRLKGHEVIRDYQPLPAVRGYPGALQQVWTNLLANALDAMEGPGRIQLRGYREGEEWVCIEIEDSGCGIAPEQLTQIFELNYTTKREGHFGLGIGLGICRQVVQQHGGRIEVSSTPGTGTRMRVWLPIAGPTPLAKEEA